MARDGAHWAGVWPLGSRRPVPHCGAWRRGDPTTQTGRPNAPGCCSLSS